MTDEPYGWKQKYFQAQRDYARLLDIVSGLAVTDNSQLDAMRDVDLVRVEEHHTVEAERDRMRERYANEYRAHLDTLDGLSKNLTHALGHLRAGRKKEALALVEQAARTINNQITPF